LYAAWSCNELPNSMNKLAEMNAQPAFALDFDPTLLFTEASADHDFDRILADLDLSLAGDNTNSVLSAIQPSQAPVGSDAAGLRELFGLQTGLNLQQQPLQQVQPDQEQKLQVLHGQPVQQAQPADVQQVLQQQQQQQQEQQLLFQQQQWQLLQQQQLAQMQQQQAHMQQQQQQAQLQQQQQQAQGLGVVYQLPSPFMQPLSALTPGLPLAMYGMQQPGADVSTLFLQQQALLNGMQQQQVLQNGAVQNRPSAGPLFTFSALPAHMQQQALSVPMSGAGSVPGLFVLPGAWPAYMQPGGISQVASPSSGTAVSPTGPLSNGSGGALTAAAAETAAPRRGRGRSAAPAGPGAEKPKGPSQRFRCVILWAGCRTGGAAGNPWTSFALLSVVKG
jgi:hypothetical protein